MNIYINEAKASSTHSVCYVFKPSPDNKIGIIIIFKSDLISCCINK